MTKTDSTDMVSSVSFSDITIKRSLVETDDGVLSLTCGYNKSGKFGYFICYEKQMLVNKRPAWVYTNQLSFIQKTNERSLTEACTQFARIVDQAQHVEK